MDSQFQIEYFNDCLEELKNENFVPASEYSFMCDDDTMARAVFAGTVFSLTPSGKFYTPWASSNVDACPHCNGKGCETCDYLGSLEAKQDQDWQDAADKWADEHGVCIESGEGDPCDIFIVEYK